MKTAFLRSKFVLAGMVIGKVIFLTYVSCYLYQIMGPITVDLGSTVSTKYLLYCIQKNSIKSGIALCLVNIVADKLAVE